MTIREITNALESATQNGQLLLTDATLPSVQIADVLSLFNLEQFTIIGATVTAIENDVILSGKTSLLGSTDVGLTMTFAEVEAGITVALSAALSSCQVPGASWVQMQEAELSITVATSGDVTGTIAGTVQTEGVEFSASILIGKIAGEFILQWTIAQIDLTAIAGLFLDGVSLPGELPNFSFVDVETRIVPASGTFSFSAASGDAWAFPAGGGGLTISEVALSVERVAVEDEASQPSSQINCAIRIAGNETLAIASEVSLNQFSLEFTLEGNDWSLSGDIAATLFDHEFSLAASYEQADGIRTLTMAAVTESLRDVVSLGESGSLGVTGLAIATTRETAEDGTTAASSWSVAAAGRIAVDNVFDFEGSLKLYREGDEAGLVFEPQQAIVTLPLPPDQQATMTLSFGDISIVRVTTEPQRSEWTFDASVGLSFQGWNQTVQRLLPETITASFKADSRSVELSVDRVLAPFDFTMPSIEIDSDTSIELGAARIDVSDLSILLGSSIELSAWLGVGLPQSLNKIFGVEADGSPSLEFFNTFDPADPDTTTIEVELSINAVTGIRLVPKTAIIKAVQLVEEEDGTYWHADLGAFGEVKFKVPEFSYDTTRSSFMASGGFETVKPLSLPLTPAKMLFSATGLTAIADLIPDGLPLKDINLVDEQGNFQIDTFANLLEEATGGDFPDELREVLEVIDSRLEQLPERFRQYLNIQIPDSFFFDIAVTPMGEVRLDVRVKDGDRPVKLLSPGFMGIIPVLNGIELRRLSFGTLAGGSLFLLQVDANIDQFDLPTLAASLLLPDDGSLPLPSTRDLHRRLVLDDLFMLIVYQTGIPIPIPLFYDNLGLEYLGLEGLQLGTLAQFPMPSLDLAEIGKLVSNFKQFFTDRDYLLDPEDAPENFNLRFSLPLMRNFLQLPAYLGSERLGSTAEGLELDTYRNVAMLMNGIKTMSLNRLIQVMPLDYRVGSVDVSFGPANLNAGWLITTPDEFRAIATQPALKSLVYAPLGLDNTAQPADLLTILPSAPPAATAPPANGEEGLVTFLRGGWNIPGVTTFQAAFGLAASGSMGFHTGFQMNAAIADVVALELGGRVTIPSFETANSSNSFQIAGMSRLQIRNHTAFEGSIELTGDRFQCQGSLNLWGVEASASLLIDSTQAIIQGEMKGLNILDGAFTLSGANGQPNPSFLMRFAANQMPTINLSGSVQLLGMRAEADVRVAETGFFFEVEGNLWDTFQCHLQASGGQFNANNDFQIIGEMRNDLFQYLNTQASQAIQADVRSATAELERARAEVRGDQQEVNRLDGLIAEQRRIIEAERASANRRLANAEADVNQKQQEVNRLSDLIKSKEQERDRLSKQQSCTRIPYWVPKPTWKNPFAGETRYKTTCVPDPVAIAKAGVVQGEITGLYTALGTATAGLEIAQGALTLAKAAVDLTPIESDPRLAGLYTARGTATLSLTAAQEVLEVTQQAVGAFGEVGDFINQYGLGSLLDVRSARFTTSLSHATGGQITMAIELVYMGQSRRLNLMVNFNNLSDTVKALSQQLLPA